MPDNWKDKQSGLVGLPPKARGRPRDSLLRPSATIGRVALVAELVGERLRAIPRRRFLAIGLACMVGMSILSVVNDARRHASEWGITSPVLVAVHPIPPGIVVTDSDVELRSFPLALLPANAIGSLGEGWVARAPIAAGQPLTGATVARDRDGLDWSDRAVTLPLPLAPPRVEAGDLVEIFGISGTAEGLAIAVVIASSGRVAEIDGDGITVVVSAAEAANLLRALAVGSVEFARRPAQP